jgi:hypothetical protein
MSTFKITQLVGSLVVLIILFAFTIGLLRELNTTKTDVEKIIEIPENDSIYRESHIKPSIIIQDSFEVIDQTQALPKTKKLVNIKKPKVKDSVIKPKRDSSKSFDSVIKKSIKLIIDTTL